MASDGGIRLGHSFELYVPTQCVCKEQLEASLRAGVLKDIKTKMSGWFGGSASTKIEGTWILPDGSLAEEPVDVVKSFADDDAFADHSDDMQRLAVSVADRLTQDAALLSVDGKGYLYSRTNTASIKCSHEIKVGAAAARPELRPIDKWRMIQTSLSSFSNLSSARSLFCGTLGHRHATGNLPTKNWASSVSALLAELPIVVADTNGFKIVYLRMAAETLRRYHERQVIRQIYKNDPSFRGLFLVSHRGDAKGNCKEWVFVNGIRASEDAGKLLLRRLRIEGDHLRTPTQQIAGLGVSEAEEATVTAEELQKRTDAAFDVEAVTKAFFAEIANWYFWAVKHTRFPEHAPKEQDGHDHVSVIRMITRLVFCWFVKEKGLIPADLFDEKKLADLLPGFAPRKVSNKESVFYRAILQNLFFATLNTEMDKRGWAKDEQNFMAHSLYRYKELFGIPGEALKLFKNIPFLNGGLFECLDKDLGEGKRPRYIRIDGFSRRPDSQPVVPDFLFFGVERELDLSEDYGDRAFRKVKVRGLIHTLNHYRFTVEESTPFEEEVALDPELAGKIFENLLAAYNPETGTTARKQSGSFYTPREIVNYMVDEALIAYLRGKLERAEPQASDVELRLRHLLSYEDEGHLFTPNDVDLLIASIDQLKALDPAVGSGAFPMGILHKLVFILGRLDPRNEKWKERQKQRLRGAMDAAERIEDATVRERTLRELEQQVTGVEEAFEKNALDYGRKLYLIENCLYGVDIQPIAVQIAKMRFFISLIADQKVYTEAENLGVRPLPNLETKLVAANTLIGIEKPAQIALRNPRIDILEADLRRVRERFFLAKTPSTKNRCREQDKALRAEIAELLKKDGWDNAVARQLADWDPYEQNASAGFFDPEWMFGIITGFDIVIGNPPYGGELDDMSKSYIRSVYKSYKYKYETYIYFIEKSLCLSSYRGVVSLITPEVWLRLDSGENIRRLLHEESQISLVRICGEKVFPNVVVNTIVFLLKKGHPGRQIEIINENSRWIISGEEWSSSDGLVINYKLNPTVKPIIEKIRRSGTNLSEFGDAIQGITPYDKYRGQSIDLIRRRGYHFDHKKDSECGKWLAGEDLSRYRIAWSGEWLRYGEWLAAPRDPKFFQGKRLLFREIPGEGKRIQATLVSRETYYHGHSITPFKLADNCQYDLRYILGVVNSFLLSWYAKLILSNFGKDTFPKINPQDVKMLPIPKLNVGKEFKKTEHDAVVNLVDRVLISRRAEPETDTSALERNIDEYVYKLFGLTKDEIKIVEEDR